MCTCDDVIHYSVRAASFCVVAVAYIIMKEGRVVFFVPD